MAPLLLPGEEINGHLGTIASNACLNSLNNLASAALATGRGWAMPSVVVAPSPLRPPGSAVMPLAQI